jgi:hypothetical protein
MNLPVSPFPDDPRMTPLREGIAARHLAGTVEASDVADPQPYRVRAASVPLRRQPDPAGPYDTELICMGAAANGFGARRDGMAMSGISRC